MKRNIPTSRIRRLFPFSQNTPFENTSNQLLGGLLGLFSAVAAMGANHYFDYLRFMEDRSAIVSLVPARRAAGQDAALLAKIKKVTDLRSFMEFSAREGITIVGNRGRGSLNLGYTGTWIYWLIELAVVTVMTPLGLVAGAREPFCSACNSWKYVRQLGTWPADQEGKVLRALQKGDLTELPPLPTLTGGQLVLSAASCLNCGPAVPIDVTLETVKKCPEGRESRRLLEQLTYPGEALEKLEAFFLAGNNLAAESPSNDAKGD